MELFNLSMRLVLATPKPTISVEDLSTWQENSKTAVQCDIPRVAPMVDDFYLSGYDDIEEDSGIIQTSNDDGTYVLKRTYSIKFPWFANGVVSLKCLAVLNNNETIVSSNVFPPSRN